ncbi:MAG: lysophospholipase [Spirochaetaceae bacterium]|jgi:alpha-beta hydrolase superfamily lysophospholipase|nr:lysophospholipase [Spirochaetaceae bacterium]
MDIHTEFFTAEDGARLALHSWLPQGEPRAVLLICHGMVEYAKRFDYPARALAEQGIAVFAHDQRGHGETAGTLDAAGYICPGDGFARVVLDLRDLVRKLKGNFPGKKIMLLGHSFGSFVSQGFIEHYGAEIDGCLLSGTAGPRPGLITAASLLVKVVIAFKGDRYRSSLLRALTFGGYNKRIAGPISPSAWLSRDPAAIQKHDADPWNTFVPTTSFFRDLMTGLERIHKKEAMRGIPKDLPVLLFAGDADPVGDYGKTVSALAGIYRANGMTDVTLALYPQGRHEMLHEINKDEVIGDILSWINERL